MSPIRRLRIGKTITVIDAQSPQAGLYCVLAFGSGVGR